MGWDPEISLYSMIHLYRNTIASATIQQKVSNVWEILHLKGASPSLTYGECSLGQEELMLSDSVQHSLGISTLNHNTLLLVGQQWWPNRCPSPPPGFQLLSSLLFHSQQEALSAASLILRAAVFLSFPDIPVAMSILHTDWVRNPLQPTLTGNSHAYHSFPLQSCKRFWYLALFLSKAWSHFPRDCKFERNDFLCLIRPQDCMVAGLSGQPGGTVAFLPGPPSYPMIGPFVVGCFMFLLWLMAFLPPSQT